MDADQNELLLRANDGDTEALRELLQLFGPRIRGAIDQQIAPQWKSLLDADDVMQVTYLEAFLNLDQSTAPNEAAFVGWLRRIAENNLRDAIKELQRKKRPNPIRRVHAQNTDQSYIALVEHLGMTTTTPSRHAAQHEACHIIDKVVDRLPGDYATVIRMYDLQGRSISEVAAEMKRSTGAVHMLRARAHDRLRSLLGAESEFFTYAAGATDMDAPPKS